MTPEAKAELIERAQEHYLVCTEALRRAELAYVNLREAINKVRIVQNLQVSVASSALVHARAAWAEAEKMLSEAEGGPP